MTETATHLLAQVRADWAACDLKLILADALDEADLPRQAALWRVIAEPHKDEHRLAFADLCDREGDRDWAEFVRVQISLARWGTDPRPYGHWHEDCRSRSDYPGTEDECHAPPLPDQGSATLCAYHRLRRREREVRPLMIEHVLDWFQGHEHVRGFVATIACEWAPWRDNGDVVRERQPIENLALTTWPRLDTVTRFETLGETRVVIAYRAVTLRDDEMLDVPEVDLEDARQHGLESRFMLRLILSRRWPGITFTLPERPRANGFGMRLLIGQPAG